MLRTLVAFIQGSNIIFEYEEDEDDDRSILEKIENFAEYTVPRFHDRQFKENFRMTPATFEDLLTKLHNGKQHTVTSGHPEMPLEKQAMITLWYLANMESFRSVGGRFGISKSTCWEVLKRICMLLLRINRQHQIIWWPSQQRAANIMTTFARSSGFPGVIGCIDGCHIKINPPQEHPNSYYNRKKFHSVLLQGVCDDKKLFTDVYSGEPGSIHDNRLFEKADLFQGIIQREIVFPNDTHLVGDLAYKLREMVMVGFKNNGYLTEQQKNFNHKLSQIRVTIENAYALLKGRFRRLKYVETVRLDLISLLIIAACVLHNICLLNGDNADDLINLEQELEELRLNNMDIQEYEQDNQHNQIAIDKRINIMNTLVPHGHIAVNNNFRLARVV